MILWWAFDTGPTLSGSCRSFGNGWLSSAGNCMRTRQIDRVRRFAAQNRKRGEGKPVTFTFLGFTHFCGRTTHAGAFTVWRITAKKRMVAKLKALKVELQRRKHDPTRETGAWLRKVVLGYYQYHAVPGSSTQLRVFWRRACRLPVDPSTPRFESLS